MSGSLTSGIRSVAVFCGSSEGHRGVYRSAAASLGRFLCQRNIHIVYGGGNVGLMGVLADAALAEGATVTGVMPQHLVDREIAHRGLSRLIIVDDMHERKAKMAELAEAFIALPGGPGTMEEFFEAWVWHQLGLHSKPVGLLSVDGYYDALGRFFEHMVEEGFMSRTYRDMIVVEKEATQLFERLSAQYGNTG
ncbi:MAG: TIGR00730 family Rossman fold protein [Spirochaetota bacterium]